MVLKDVFESRTYRRVSVGMSVATVVEMLGSPLRVSEPVGSPLIGFFGYNGLEVFHTDGLVSHFTIRFKELGVRVGRSEVDREATSAGLNLVKIQFMSDEYNDYLTADGVTVIVLDGFVSYVGIVDKEMDWPKMEASWKAKHPEDV